MIMYFFVCSFLINIDQFMYSDWGLHVWLPFQACAAGLFYFWMIIYAHDVQKMLHMISNIAE